MLLAARFPRVPHGKQPITVPGRRNLKPAQSTWNVESQLPRIGIARAVDQNADCRPTLAAPILDRMDLPNLVWTAVTTLSSLFTGAAQNVVQRIAGDRLHQLISGALASTGSTALTDLARNPHGRAEQARLAGELQTLASRDPGLAATLEQAVHQVHLGTGAQQFVMAPSTGAVRIGQGGFVMGGQQNTSTRTTKIGAGGLAGIILAGLVFLGLAGVVVTSFVGGPHHRVGECLYLSGGAAAKIDCSDPRAVTITRVVEGGQNPLAYCSGSGGWYVDDKAKILYCVRSR